MCARGGSARVTRPAVEARTGLKAIAGSAQTGSCHILQSVATSSKWTWSGAHTHREPRTELEQLVAEMEESCNDNITSSRAWGAGPTTVPLLQRTQQDCPEVNCLDMQFPNAVHDRPTLPGCEDWAVIRDVMMLAEQKEAEVFGTLLAYREKQIASLCGNCNQTQGEIKKLIGQSTENSKLAAEGTAKVAVNHMHDGAAKGYPLRRGIPASFRPSSQLVPESNVESLSRLAHRRENTSILSQLDEVSVLATPSSPSTARLETASGSQSLDTYTQTATPYWLTPRLQVFPDEVQQEPQCETERGPDKAVAGDEASPTVNALRSLREKDELLSIGVNWLEGELEDAKLLVQHVKEAAMHCGASAGSHQPRSQKSRDSVGDARVASPAVLREPPWMAENHGMQPVISPLASPFFSSLSHGDECWTKDLLSCKVAEFLEAPEHQHCKSLLRRTGPGVYLYGSTPVALRIGISTGQLEVSCDMGLSWARLSDFVSCMDRAHDDLVQRAWAIVSINRQ